MNEVKFKCPNCNSNRLEVVTVDCIVASEVIFMSDDGSPFAYGEPEVHDGDHDCFQCWECGYRLTKNGNSIDEDEVLQWIKDN